MLCERKYKKYIACQNIYRDLINDQFFIKTMICNDFSFKNGNLAPSK